MATNGPIITVAGNLTRDPELRYTPNGVPMCKITVAVTPREKIDNEWRDGDAQFWDVTAWRQLGENVAESLTRGDPVIVTGSVKFREWESKEGEKRHAHEITADTVGISLAFHSARVRRSERARADADPGETAPAAFTAVPRLTRAPTA